MIIIDHEDIYKQTGSSALDLKTIEIRSLWLHSSLGYTHSLKNIYIYMFLFFVVYILFHANIYSIYIYFLLYLCNIFKSIGLSHFWKFPNSKFELKNMISRSQVGPKVKVMW